MNIAELRRLEAEVTPGPLRVYKLSSGDVIVETSDPIPLNVARFHQGAIVNARREAALYVAMRNALPELLKALEEARSERDLLQDILDARPSINAGLPESYIRWSQSLYSGELIRAALDHMGRNPLPPHGGVDDQKQL